MSDLEQLLASYDEGAALEQASTIPAGWYTDERVAKLERERVFGSGWLAVGRTDQAARGGEFFTLDVAGEPLVVVRGADGVLRGFFNVCRHHAAAVATEEQGVAQVFRCPYHGWTYGLDGSLKGTPDFAGVCGFDRASNGLVPVRVAVWESFVFASLAGGGESLEEWLGDLAGRMAGLDLGGLRFHERRVYELNCNWKVYVDNYLDGGYHVPYLHKSLNSVLDYAQYSIENGGRYSVQWSPMAPGGDAEVDRARAGERADYIWLYPNFMMNVYGGVMDTNLVLPLGVSRTRVIFDFYFSEASVGRAAASIGVSDLVQQEDVGVCEAVQRGLGSRAYGAGRLSVRREGGEHLFHRLLALDLKGR